MSPRLLSVAIIASVALGAPAFGQRLEMQPHPPDRLTAVMTFFATDSTIPLDVHVVERARVLGFMREKLVFTGARGGRVPAYCVALQQSGRAWEASPAFTSPLSMRGSQR